MRKRITDYTVRREGEKWILEWDEEVTRIEHVEIPLEIEDPDDINKVVEEVSRRVGCYPQEVKIRFEY